MLRIVAIIIEKGLNNERINPSEAPRIRKKTLKMNVIKSVTPI